MTHAFGTLSRPAASTPAPPAKKVLGKDPHAGPRMSETDSVASSRGHCAQTISYDLHALIPASATATLRARTVRLPDIGVGAAVAHVVSADSVSAKLTSSATVKEGTGIVGSADFGAAGWRDVSLSKVAVTPQPKLKAFMVTAQADVTITWEVRKGKGPSDQVSIDSATDPDITKTNWPDVVKDLTPNKDGVSPRRKFWCRDLTVKHEGVHTRELKGFVPAAAKTVNTWLNGETATDVAAVNTLLLYVPSRVYEALTNLYLPGSEERAYREIGPSFRARANAIARMGRRGAYK